MLITNYISAHPSKQFYLYAHYLWFNLPYVPHITERTTFWSGVQIEIVNYIEFLVLHIL